MKKVLIIAPQQNPIPAIRGGAVETLITHLIDENEIHKKVKFFIISTYDKDALKYSYRCSQIIYVNSKNTFARLIISIKNFFRKLVFNRLTKNLFSTNSFWQQRWTAFGYQSFKIAKRINPDIIVSESYDQFNRLWPLVKHFKKTVFYYHPHYVREENPSLRRLFPNTIAISNCVLNHWVKDETILGENVVVFNGIDIGPYLNDLETETKHNLRKSLSIKDDDFVVLFTGRLRPHKGLLELLKAFSGINNKLFKLLILGDFLSETNRSDKDMESEFEKKCMSIIDNDDRIIRVGRVDYKNMPDYYHISDIQCIPSTCEEGAGLVAVEGMASGLPLIITRSGGLPEYTGNDCAIVLNLDNNLEDNIKKTIVRLFSDKTLRNSMSKSGRARAVNFSKEKYYQDYIGVILNKISD